jgi:hypothetical protein
VYDADHTIWQLKVENRSTQCPDVTVTLSQSQSQSLSHVAYRIRHRRDRHRCAHVQSLVCVSWEFKIQKFGRRSTKLLQTQYTFFFVTTSSSFFFSFDTRIMLQCTHDTICQQNVACVHCDCDDQVLGGPGGPSSTVTLLTLLALLLARGLLLPTTTSATY